MFSDFSQKNVDISKINGAHGTKRYNIFSETKCVCVYFRTKFQVFKLPFLDRKGNFIPPTPKQPLKSPA